MGARQIFRKEHFGGILYDARTLRFKLVPDGPAGAERIIEKKLPARKDIVSAPVRVYFEITKKCNLACRHCFVGATGAAYEGLSLSEMKRILDEFENEGVIDIRFTGGEPTTRKDWFELLSYAKNKGFAVSLNTNGMYNAPGEIAAKLSSLNLEQVTISLDGLGGTHDYFRGSGSFETMMRSARTMAAAGVKLRFNTVLTRMNVHQIPEILDLADGLVEEINFFYLRPVGRGVSQNHLSLSYDEHFLSAEQAIMLRKNHPGLNIMHFEQSFVERSILKSEGIGQLREALPYGNTTIGITCDGGVWPHGYTPYQDERLLLGNLTKESLRSIWTSSEKLDALRKWFRELMARCKGCGEYLVKCAGLNFEMETAKAVGDIKENPFCISSEPVPPLEIL